MNEHLFTNANGLRLITGFEGEPRLKARLCEGGAWELGYGVTFGLDGQPFKEGDTCTPEYADALFRNALKLFEDGVRNLVTVPLNANQFSALVAFAYNIGLENLAGSTVLRRVNEGRMDDAAASFGMWVFATKNGHKQALRGLLRRRYAEALLFMGYDWTVACDNDAIALQREIPATFPGTDRVIYKTPFKDVLAVAQAYPLEAPELTLTQKAEPAPSVAPASAGQPVSDPQPQTPAAPASVKEPAKTSPDASVASKISPNVDTKPATATVSGPPVAGPVAAPSAPQVPQKPLPVPVPAKPVDTKPPAPPVVIAQKQIDVRTVPYGEIPPDGKPKNMTDSARVIGLVIVGIGSIVQVLSAREIISTTIGAIFYDLSRDTAFVAMAAGGVAMLVGWATRKRGVHVVTKGMVNATALLK